jgi:sporulation protein YlmC with PRC-barrel domain
MARPATPTQDPLIGLAVFSSDGNKLGTVDSVDGEPDGKISAINIRTGGFLGFGMRVVAIPEGKFQRVGQFVQIALTAEEIGKLPALKDLT